MTGHTATAAMVETVVDAMVTVADPGARVSAPLWRRTERLSRGILDALRTELAGSAEMAAVERTLDALCAAPLDTGAQAMLANSLHRALSAVPTVAAALQDPVDTWRLRNRIVRCTGAGFRPEQCPPPPSTQQLAEWCRAETWDLDGHWDLTVVLDVRDSDPAQGRFRNTLAALAALHHQSLPRHRYRIVVHLVMDREPRG